MTDETFDATILTLKILSCIYRVQERYGARLIAETLYGSKSKNVIRFNLNQISTYGIIKEFSIPQIQAVVDELLKQGFLYRSPTHIEVKLAPKGKRFLKEKPAFFLSKQLLEDARSLFFSPKPTAFHMQTLTLWQRGATIEEIAKLQKRAVSTINDKIVDLVYHGKITDWNRLIPDNLFKTIATLLKKNMSGKLRDVKNQLPEEVTWIQIKTVLAVLEKNKL